MGDQGFPVKLYLYDISHGMARSMSQSLLGKYIEGIWHSGLVVYGREYYWGGIIQVGAPGTSPYGTPNKVIDLGVTHIPMDVMEDFLNDIKHNYTVQTYSLLSYNCNNFSNEISNFLLGKDIPTEVKDLPREVLSTPFGQMIRPFIEQMESQAKQYVDPGMYAPNTAYSLPNRGAPVNASTQLPDMSQLSVKEPSVTFDHDRLVENFVWIKKSNLQPLLGAQAVIDPIIDKILAMPNNTSAKIELEDLRAQLKGLPKECSLTQPTVSFIMSKLDNLDDSECFLIMYILRLLITDEKFNRSVVSRRAPLLRGLLSKYIPATAPNKNVRAMALLLGANLFVTGQGREFMLHKETTDAIFDHVIDCLTSSVEDLKLPAAGLLYNYCQYFPKTMNFEDLVIQSVSCFTEILRSLTTVQNVNAEFVFRLLFALGHCLLNNSIAVELALSLELKSICDFYSNFNADQRVKQLALEIKQLAHI